MNDIVLKEDDLDQKNVTMMALHVDGNQKKKTSVEM